MSLYHVLSSVIQFGLDTLYALLTLSYSSASVSSYSYQCKVPLHGGPRPAGTVNHLVISWVTPIPGSSQLFKSLSMDLWTTAEACWPHQGEGTDHPEEEL